MKIKYQVVLFREKIAKIMPIDLQRKAGKTRDESEIFSADFKRNLRVIPTFST